MHLHVLVGIKTVSTLTRGKEYSDIERPTPAVNGSRKNGVIVQLRRRRMGGRRTGWEGAVQMYGEQKRDKEGKRSEAVLPTTSDESKGIAEASSSQVDFGPYFALVLTTPIQRRDARMQRATSWLARGSGPRRRGSDENLKRGRERAATGDIELVASISRLVGKAGFPSR